jgi:glycosyltransferase 2 family protein
MGGGTAKFRQWSRALLLVVQATVSACLVAWLLSRFDFQTALGVVASADKLFVVCGVACAIVVVVCLGLRLHAVLRKGSLPVPASDALAIASIGQFWNFFLPGSAGGDLYKMAAIWKRHPSRRAEGLIAVFFDRLVATTLLGFAGLFGLPRLLAVSDQREFGLSSSLRPSAIWFLALCPVALLLLPQIRSKARSFVRHISNKLVEARIYLRLDELLGRIMLWSIVCHTANFAAFYCFSHAVGLEVRFVDVFLFLPIVLVLLIAPISLNGHGVREVLLVYMFSSLGVTPPAGVELPEAVLALSVLGLSSDLVMGIVGGGVFLFRRGLFKPVSAESPMSEQRPVL